LHHQGRETALWLVRHAFHEQHTGCSAMVLDKKASTGVAAVWDRVSVMGPSLLGVRAPT
jgi:hypothetical protein